VSITKSAREKEDVGPFKNFVEKEYSYHLKLEVDKAKAIQKRKSRGMTFTINL